MTKPLDDHIFDTEHLTLQFDATELAPGGVPWIRLTYGPMVSSSGVFHQMFPLEAGYHYRRHREMFADYFDAIVENAVVAEIDLEVAQSVPIIVHRQPHDLYIGIPGVADIYQD